MLGLSLVLMSVLAAPAGGLDSPDAAVRALASAADVRDVKALAAVLHPDFRVTFAVKGKPGATVLDRATYLGLITAGKIGGAPRAFAPGWRAVDEHFAQVQSTLTGAHGRFEIVSTVVHGAGGWQVIAESTRMVPTAK